MSRFAYAESSWCLIFEEVELVSLQSFLKFLYSRVLRCRSRDYVSFLQHLSNRFGVAFTRRRQTSLVVGGFSSCAVTFVEHITKYDEEWDDEVHTCLRSWLSEDVLIADNKVDFSTEHYTGNSGWQSRSRIDAKASLGRAGPAKKLVEHGIFIEHSVY